MLQIGFRNTRGNRAEEAADDHDPQHEAEPEQCRQQEGQRVEHRELTAQYAVSGDDGKKGRAALMAREIRYHRPGKHAMRASNMAQSSG